MIIGRFTNRMVPLARVRHMDALPRSGDGKTVPRRIQVSFGEDQTADYAESDVYGALENTVQASFPADGAKLIDVYTDDKRRPEGVFYRNVLGFYIDGLGDLRAVTMEGTETDFAIMFADGHIEEFEGHFANADEYLAAKVKEFDDVAAKPKVI